MNNPDYQAALEYLYQHLPMYQRIGAKAYKADLNNTIALCAAFGNPQNNFKSAHVAGTNGKGSSSHMLAAVLQNAGYKTGLYTSPHLKEFTERIRIDGEEISKEFVVNFVSRSKNILEAIRPSFFETTVAMAFDYFASEKVDIAVVEVGLGGRLDSTNIIHPLVSLITNISYDHTDLLGETLEKIAFEKSGIIKPGVPVVISETQDEVSEVFMRKAGTEGSPIVFANDQYRLEQKHSNEVILYDVYRNGRLIFENLVPGLKGSYQRRNLPGTLATLDELRKVGFDISDEHIRNGIENVVTITKLKGRWQVLGERPLVICDTGHNEDGIREIVRQLESTPHQHLHMVIGVVADKDVSKMFALLPKDASYYFCAAKIPRAMPAIDVESTARPFGLHGMVIPDVNEAILKAKQKASSDDLIFVGGSTFVVAEIMDL